MQKGVHPDVLVMTATPIPRTLALTIYGDLDVSRDRRTAARPQADRDQARRPSDRIEQVYSFLKKQIDEGRQAYVVYPVIEESETQAMKAAQKMHEHLRARSSRSSRSGLLHGRLARRREGSGDGALQGGRDRRSWCRPR